MLEKELRVGLISSPRDRFLMERSNLRDLACRDWDISCDISRLAVQLDLEMENVFSHDPLDCFDPSLFWFGDIVTCPVMLLVIMDEAANAIHVLEMQNPRPPHPSPARFESAKSYASKDCRNSSDKEGRIPCRSLVHQVSASELIKQPAAIVCDINCPVISVEDMTGSLLSGFFHELQDLKPEEHILVSTFGPLGTAVSTAPSGSRE